MPRSDTVSWEGSVAAPPEEYNGSCGGSVTMEIDGGPFSSPLTAVSLVGTALTGAGMALALRPLFGKVG